MSNVASPMMSDALGQKRPALIYPEDVRGRPATAGVPAEVWTSSHRGILLLAEQWLDPGQLVRLCLESETGQETHVAQLRIVHVVGTGRPPPLRWLMGCAFTREEDAHACLLPGRG